MFELDADKANRQVLPIGSYEVRIKEARLEQAKTSENWQLKLRMEVLEGPSKGKDVWEWLSLADTALWRSIPILRGMGLDIPEHGKVQVDEGKLIGCHFTATLDIDNWNGTDRNRLKAAAASDKKFSAAEITAEVETNAPF